VPRGQRDTDPYGRILGFLDRSRYFFYQVAGSMFGRERDRTDAL
jgi:hypothetical protein